MSASEADIERRDRAQWNAEIARGNARSQLLGLRGGCASVSEGTRKGQDAEEDAGGAGAETGAGAGAREEAEAQWEAASGAAL